MTQWVKCALCLASNSSASTSCCQVQQRVSTRAYPCMTARNSEEDLTRTLASDT